MGRRLLQHRRDALVGPIHRSGELPCSCFGILEQLGKASVNLDAPKARGCLVDAGGEQGMCEADSLAVDLDDVRHERWLQTVRAWDAGGSLGDRDRRVRVRGCRQQEVTALVAQSRNATVDEIVQRLGQRQRLAGFDGNPGPPEHADDLESEERISAGRLMHLGEERSGKRRAEMQVDDAPESHLVERVHVNESEELSRRRPQELVE